MGFRISAQDVDLSTKQDALVSGTNIKTVNGEDVLGSGDVAIPTGIVFPYVAENTTYIFTFNIDPDTDGIYFICENKSTGKKVNYSIKDDTGLRAFNDNPPAGNVVITKDFLEAYAQEKLTSGTNIKTLNGQSILGAGNLVVSGGASEVLKSNIPSLYYQKVYGVGGSPAWTSGNFTAVGGRSYVVNEGVLCLRHSLGLNGNGVRHGITKGSYAIDYAPSNPNLNVLGIPIKLFPIEFEARVKFYNAFYANRFQFGFANNATTSLANQNGRIGTTTNEMGIMGMFVYLDFNLISGTSLVKIGISWYNTIINNVATIADVTSETNPSGFSAFPFWKFKMKSNIANQTMDFYFNDTIIYQASFSVIVDYVAPACGLALVSQNNTPSEAGYFDLDYIYSNF